MAMIIITHDLGLVASVADSVLVMYAGRAAERCDARTAFYSPHHPYTRGLLASIPGATGSGGRLVPITGNPPSLIRIPSGCAFHPRCPFAMDVCARDQPDLAPVGDGAGHESACWLPPAWWGRGPPSTPRASASWPRTAAHRSPASAVRSPPREGPPSMVESIASAADHDGAAAAVPVVPDVLLRVDNVVKLFPIRRGVFFKRQVGAVHAVEGVSLEVRRGETLGVVGETGCGKSTLARCMTRLHQLTSGKVVFDGADISRSVTLASCGPTVAACR